MCKVNGLNHKALDVRTPCVCIRKASFRETNMPTLGAEMPKNAPENTLLLCGTVLSERWKSLFRTVIKPLPRGGVAQLVSEDGVPACLTELFRSIS